MSPIKFIFSPITLLLQGVLFVPLVYFKTKLFYDIDPKEIQPSQLPEELFQKITLLSSQFEDRGFKKNQLIEIFPSESSRLILQTLIDEKNGISLGLCYGLIKNSSDEYDRVTVEYQEFSFETKTHKSLEFHNNPKDSIKMSNQVERFYIDEPNLDIFYKIVLDIAKREDVDRESLTIKSIKRDATPIILYRYREDMNYLIAKKFYKLKGSFLHFSFRASLITIAKEFYPLAYYFTSKNRKRTANYFKSIDFVENYGEYHEPWSIHYQKKIDRLSLLKKYVEDSYHYNIEYINFYLNDQLEYNEISIGLIQRKAIDSQNHIYRDFELTFNNRQNRCYYSREIAYNIAPYREITSIKELDRFMEPSTIAKQIKRNHPSAFFHIISLSYTKGSLSYSITFEEKNEQETNHFDPYSGVEIYK